MGSDDAMTSMETQDFKGFKGYWELEVNIAISELDKRYVIQKYMG